MRGHWQDRIVDHLTPRVGGRRYPGGYEPSITLELVVARKSPYRCFGRITDGDGNPVPALRVAVGTSWHEPPQTYGDERHYQETQTDAEGNYSVDGDTRFANGVWVNTSKAVGGVDAQGDELLPPGRYDFVVRPQ